jgi:hypothetical protein
MDKFAQTDLVREWCVEFAKARGIWPPKPPAK